MTLRSAYVPCLLAILAAACGGSVFASKDDTGAGGSATGGSAGHAGSTSSAGKPGTAGSSASAGSSSVGGSVGAGGSGGSGGTAGSGGTISMAGSAGMAGGPNCAAVDCAFPVCADNAAPVTVAGQCCPTCPLPNQTCGGVTCEPVMACPMGYTLGKLPGACCQGCVPAPGGVSCPKIACGDKTCPLGYVRGDLVGGCCSDCVSDPLFCNSGDDCVIADRPRPCCGCPEAVSKREYAADPCWSALDTPRMTPQSCQPQFQCNIVCAPCAPPGSPVCKNHRCVEL